MQIPYGEKIILDGTIENTEWMDAAKFKLVNGGDILIKQNATQILIGITGTEMGWVHICITISDFVFVLHSSAALGTAKYLLSHNGLALLQIGFKWEMRDSTQSATAKSERTSYLKLNKWIASTAWMGNPNEREFIIDKKIFQKSSPKIAIMYASDEPKPDYYYWPETLSDDSLNEQLALGRAPDSLLFNPDHWAILKFDSKLYFK